MSKSKIMCTSTGCIDYAPERYSELGIAILRVHVIYGGNEYKEGLDLDPVAFYEYLDTLADPKKNLPSHIQLPSVKPVYQMWYFFSY